MAASIGRVSELAESWRPRKCKTEKEYELSLFRHLEKNLEQSDIIRQYAVGRIRGDIVVDKTILIEIKKGLDSMSQYQRLKGQIDDYANQWDGYVLLVFCGDVQRDLKKEIERQANSHTKSSPWNFPLLPLSREAKIEIIYK